ncbi:ion channel [Vreelandella sulfidaeris]|uniref:ion channel n=1 Tax=Vreelandella sulfidaeris TaxID=115553 RepID=UPI0035EC47D7|tara:strand:- start:2126 stop:2575 length:450 start_codon:yes stop_codon:yes gene_type:complete
MTIPYPEHIAVVSTTFVTVVIAVMLHYEALWLISRQIDKSRRPHRQRILAMVFSVIMTHIAEIWLFGIAGWWLTATLKIGALQGYDSFNLLDYIFFSAATYTTVGYGDIYATGPVRFLYGTLALTGFVLITWSASFTFIEMQKHWRGDR